MVTSIRVRHVSRCPEIGPICEERDEPPQRHDQRFTVTEWKAGAAYGVSETLGFEVMVPFKWVRTEITYRRLDGTEFTPDYENIHHRDETLYGIGDPRIGGRTGWRVRDGTVSVLTGLSVPLGRTEKNPFERGAAGIPHQHLQFGTGTYDPFVAFDVRHPIAEWRARVFGDVLVPIFVSPYGFQAGDRVTVAGEGSRLVARGIRVSGSLVVAHEEPERWDGKIQQDGNLGRTDLLAGVSATFPLREFALSVDASTPVYQKIHGGQLDYPGILGVSLGRTF